MAQQGPPPGQSPRDPGTADDGGYERGRSDRARPDRARPDRARRAERHEAANWRQLEEAFRPGSDADLPEWAGPVYQPRPAPPRRPARTRLEDPYRTPDDVAADDYPGGAGPGGAGSGPGSSGPGSTGYRDAGRRGSGDRDAVTAGGAGQAGTGYRGRRRGADADADAVAAIADDIDIDWPDQTIAGQPDDPAATAPAAEPTPRRIGRRRGRAAATRLRRSRRRVVQWCAVAIVACVLAAGITAFVTHHAAAKTPYVTSLLPGEYKAVPDACSSVTAATLSQYLPGPGLVKTDELAGSGESECSFGVDHKPVFLVLEVTSQQYQPFAAASGNGSASANAQDNFALAEQALLHPAPHSPLSAAAISPLAGVGQQGIIGYQHEHVSGITSDLVTVLTRLRNVVVTVSLSGQESGHGFGPVPLATLEAGATAAAKDALARLRAEPAA